MSNETQQAAQAATARIYRSRTLARQIAEPKALVLFSQAELMVAAHAITSEIKRRQQEAK